ncbi:flavin-binding monooxygenase-like protein (macronuclear) [Tetrahymena thermophila SB210]|uniref:Flavin-binding monooxygenase-like protein n=1 Tax=Tetrahymena thermophila (strain SB210) TaxID=312017 RepID=I7MH07_TETTS|nr:flavin-binding monooxygenase-like protein [Tetrahymena thermophila SB210]EAR85652.1 flavin-binding monooxygenase-like protein [Tetrahymena thermophila SB210]|eukprot:XP_001033315.1 flavin-binding monooxygenase-like protein [Tetrahymena thermophila SB210]
MSAFNQLREDQYKNNYSQKSVIVVGAGPLGILSVRYLSQETDLNTICFEAKNNIGGMWYLDDYDRLDSEINTSKNAFIRDNGYVQSSLYENLRLNSVKMKTMYKGYPIPKEFHEYMKQDEFLQYMRGFADNYGLKNYISFETYVNYVRLVGNMTQSEKEQIPINLTKKFLVEVVSYNNYEKDVRHFQADYVICCSGHYSKPNIIKIPNQQIFEGKIDHTHHFRERDGKQLANKNLVIIGQNTSCQDIFSLLLFESEITPKKITVIGRNSVQHLKNATSLQEVIKKGLIEFIQDECQEFNSKNSLLLKSGKIIENIDSILLATGYQFCFHYLNKFNHIDNCIEYYENNRSIGPLYNKIISINEPNLIFLGSINGSSQQHYERQAIYSTHYILGKLTLPTKEEMMQDFEDELKKNGGKKGYLGILKLPNFTSNHDQYVKKLYRDMKGIEFDDELQQTWLLYAKLYEKHSNAGNYYEMKFEDLSQMPTRDYVPKLGLF